MNKKLFLIPIAIGLVIFFIAISTKKDETGNKFEMTIPDVADNSSVNKDLKGVSLYLDNSGSMKGYLDFARMSDGNMANATFISTLSNFMDRIKSSYNIEPICYCGGRAYDRSGFLRGMGDFSIFTGAVTDLHNAINDLVNAATDSTIAIFASDMILSYGRRVLEAKGKYYNKQQLEQLGAYIHDAMTNAKDKGYHVLLLQYYGDFNGQYYYNYTENIDPNTYTGTLMRQRPYYLLMVGKESFLRNVAAQKAFIKPAHIYASFSVPQSQAKQTYEISPNDNNVAWIIGNPDPQYSDAPGTIMTNADFGDAVSSLKFSYTQFEIPAYVNVQENGYLKAEWNQAVIQDVSFESVPTDGTQLMIVTLQPHCKIQTMQDVSIRLCSDNNWVNHATTDDDTQGADIAKKTWGFSTIVNNINKVYRKENTIQPETIATLSFDVIIK